MIIANWKMNGSKELIKDWMDFVSQNIEINQEKECILCPPTCYLYFTGTLIKQSYEGIKLGSQHCDSVLSAPLTGGTNSQMLEDAGCEFVIIGHSEQRVHLKESNQILSDKLKSSIGMNLKPIFCIGETLRQKEANQTNDILIQQLDAIPSNLLQKCIIAYEPVWAIGTGENAEISYIEEIHSFIKEELKNKSNSTNYISVVYGGSVNLDNCKEIYSSDKVDGLLIGGASLDSNTFTKIFNIS
jgi:triosephosphate isomerase